LNNDFHKLSENSNEWVRIKDEIRKVDNKIDKEVYKLYGLSEDEMKKIENTK